MTLTRDTSPPVPLVLTAPCSTDTLSDAPATAQGQRLGSVQCVQDAFTLGAFNTRQAEQFLLLETARERLLDNKRLQNCHRYRIDAARPVTAYLAENGFIWFDNLQTCGLTVCPVCGPRIAWTQRRRAVSIARGADAFGFMPYALTLTSGHAPGDDLGSLIARQLWAVGGMFNGGSAVSTRLKSAGIGYAGYCRALECVSSSNAGHHPHVHAVLFAEHSPVQDMTGLIREAYAKQGRRAGLELGDHAAHVLPLFDDEGVRDFNAVGYAFKDGLGQHARGPGLTPPQLLRAARQGDKDAGRLWLDYAETVTGLRRKRLAFFSPGLARFSGVV